MHNVKEHGIQKQTRTMKMNKNENHTVSYYIFLLVPSRNVVTIETVHVLVSRSTDLECGDPKITVLVS